MLEVSELCVALSGRQIVDCVSFSVSRGRLLGIVGESGSGKSVTAQALLGLVPVSSGQIALDGTRLDSLTEKAWRSVRAKRIGMVFQDPMSAFLPVRQIGAQIVEQIRAHEAVPRKAAMMRAIALLGRMGVPDPERVAHAYPHQLSGGLRQRAMIAMALSCAPDLVVADEPTTALDVTVQAQILSLLREIADQGRACILITHDLGVVDQVCDDVMVLYGGVVLERGPADVVLSTPAHPYTQGLLAATPDLDAPKLAPRMQAIPGAPPSPETRPEGCVFAPRCPHVSPACETRPVLRAHAGRDVACVLYEGEAA